MQKKKKMNDFWKKVVVNVINSLIAAILIFLGALSGGNITMETICFSLIAALIVLFTKLKDFWSKEEENLLKDVKGGLFRFI